MNGSSLTPFALFFMLISMGTVTSLTAYCYYRILFAPNRNPPAEERHEGSDSTQPVKL
jgi:hypothetical protein